MMSFSIPKFPKELRIVISLFFVGVLIYLAKPIELWERLQHVSIELIAILVLGLVVQLAILGLMYWRIIQRFISISYVRFMKWYLMGWSTEFFLPGKLGAFSIAYLLRQEKVDLGVGTAMVLFVKFITLLMMIGIILLVLPLQFFTQTDYWLIIGGVGAGLLVVAGLFFTAVGRKLLRDLFARFGAEKFKGFGSTLARFWKSPLLVAQTLALLFLSLGVNAFVLSLAYGSLGYSVPLVQLLAILSLSQLAGAIPISLNGIGVKEGVTVFLLAQVGVPTSLGVLISAINSGVGILLGLIVGVILARELPKIALSKSEENSADK